MQEAREDPRLMSRESLAAEVLILRQRVSNTVDRTDYERLKTEITGLLVRASALLFSCLAVRSAASCWCGLSAAASIDDALLPAAESMDPEGEPREGCAPS